MTAQAFPGFENLFSLGDILANRPYRGTVIGWHDSALALSRGETEPRGTLLVEWAMGSGMPGDVVWTTYAHPVLVHARVLEVFADADELLGNM